jgi:hypothetical protein
MGARLNNEDVIKRIKEIHDNLYDLSQVFYKNRRIKIELVCQKHGSWFSYTEQLFRGQGCPKCGKIKAGKAQRTTFYEFVKIANKIHGNKYNYFESSYSKLSSSMEIECPEHGVFFQKGSEHIHQSQGCRKCGLLVSAEKRRLDVKEFILRSKKVHEDKYEYSKVNYVRNSDKVIITCPKHGGFMQEPQNHLNGSGCLKCALDEQVLRQIKTTEDFIRDSKIVHGNKYDYSRVNYVNSKSEVQIVCKKHGVFNQIANTHQFGSGCPNCNVSRRENQKILRKE